MVDEFQAVRFLEKKRTNSGPFMESTSKHSIYTLTLYTTPVVYLYLDRFQLWCARLHRRRKVGIPEEVYQEHVARGVEVGA